MRSRPGWLVFRTVLCQIRHFNNLLGNQTNRNRDCRNNVFPPKKSRRQKSLHPAGCFGLSISCVLWTLRHTDLNVGTTRCRVELIGWRGCLVREGQVVILMRHTDWKFGTTRSLKIERGSFLDEALLRLVRITQPHC